MGPDRPDFSLGAIAVIALNPGLYYLYIVDGHNDILGVAALALGLVSLSRNLPWLAFALSCAAGLIKLSFIPVAIVTISHGRTPRERMLYAAGTIGVTLGTSLLWGGTAYVRALRGVGQRYAYVVTGRHELTLYGPQACLIVAMLAVVIVAIVQRRYMRFGSYTFVGISGWFEPWYLAGAFRTRFAAGKRR